MRNKFLQQCKPIRQRGQSKHLAFVSIVIVSFSIASYQGSTTRPRCALGGSGTCHFQLYRYTCRVYVYSRLSFCLFLIFSPFCKQGSHDRANQLVKKLNSYFPFIFLSFSFLFLSFLPLLPSPPCTQPSTHHQLYRVGSTAGSTQTATR